MFIVIVDGSKNIRIDSNDIKDYFVYRNIEITKEGDEYIITLKHGFYFSDRDKIRALKCKKYTVLTGEQFGDIDIYVYENSSGLFDYSLYNNEPFILSSNNKSNIINLDEHMNKYYLVYRNNMLETNYENLLVNGKVYKNEVLNEADEIEFLNFRFIYYKSFLYINNFYVSNKLPKYKTEKVISKHRNIVKEEMVCFDIYDNKLVIDELKEYKPKVINNSKKLIFQLGPSITMSIAMIGIASINIYNNYLSGGTLLNSVVYIVMPISMLITGVLWPLVSNSFERNNNKKENQKIKYLYLKYLDAYLKELKERINTYIKKENKYYFDGTVGDGKLFYLNNKHPMFLKLSIGHTIIKKDLDIKYTSSKKINEKLDLINKELSISNYPYYLDVKKYRCVSIVTNRKVELIKRFILELSIKNHYDEYYICLYSSDLSNYYELFSIPSLILNNKRLTLNKTSELLELISIKLDKPLILFSDEKININITNKDIHLINICEKEKEINRNSEVVIKYDNTGGIIYDNKEISFSNIYKKIDFVNLVKLISPYQNVNFLNKCVTFKDVFKGLDIESYYSSRQIGLRADFALCDDEQLHFDLHESKSGPHGLIAGSTGSGKSELIVSLLLSLCIRYRPDYLNIILIDYKGGGIEESLSYKGNRLPHIIAAINNLENDIFERLIVAIDFECKKRQRLFKELSNKAMTSIMNIDDYLECDYKKYGLEKIPHLLIVVDEFAEMKKENPEIIKELISFSRIGRSLGLHLILATQRPSGVIDEEIWSNSRFKIALKVFNEKDSNDVIKSNKAAYLNNPGEFYLGVDESLIKAKSIYSKTDINNGEPLEVSLLDNKLEVLKKKVVKNDNPLLESSYIVDKILKTSNELSIDKNKLDFSKPKEKSKEELENLYKDSGLILGEIDDYLNAKKGLLMDDIRNNIFIYSSRNNEINNILNSLDRQSVVIGSRKYSNKYISDSIVYENQDDINYLFKELLDKDLDITLVIEDVISLQSFSESYISDLYQLVRRSDIKKMNIIIISKQSLVNFKLLNFFKNKYAIKIYESQDLINIFSSRTNYKGDSYFYNDYLISFVPVKEERFIEDMCELKPIMKYVPETVNYHKSNGQLLIGVELTSREEIYISENEKLLVSSYDDKIIDKYKEIFKDDLNVEVIKYDKKHQKSDINKIIWLGEGLYSQRLFYIDGKEELKDNEAYYYKGNKGTLIRFINNG